MSDVVMYVEIIERDCSRIEWIVDELMVWGISDKNRFIPTSWHEDECLIEVNNAADFFNQKHEDKTRVAELYMSRHLLRWADNGCTVIFPQLLQCSGTTSSNVGRNTVSPRPCCRMRYCCSFILRAFQPRPLHLLSMYSLDRKSVV